MSNPSNNHKNENQNASLNNHSQGFISRHIAMYKNALILAVFAFVSTGLIGITHLLTKDKIAEEVEILLIKQLSEIVPASHYSNDVFDDCIFVQDKIFLGSDQDVKLFRMRNAKKPYAVLLTAIAPDGYSGKIELAIAISYDGDLKGVNILTHQETPGLGDKIERNKSDWLNQFDGLSLIKFTEKQWKVKKDGGEFDALTGATITPRAVVKAVYNSMLFYKNNRSSLFETVSSCSDTESRL